MRAVCMFCVCLLPALAAGPQAVVAMVSMRDGVHMATDIYLPEGDGKYPVLLARSPYNKSGERRRGIFFAQHGYVFVAQDCRGTGASEGHLQALVHEGTDGYDAIEWCARQPWSNGSVGTLGASYLAMDQYAAALERPPHLVAMYAAVGSANLYFDSTWRGGVPSLGWPLWLLRAAATSPLAVRNPEWKRKLDSLMAKPEPWLALDPRRREEVFRDFPDQLRAHRDFYEHPSFDSYWKQKGFDLADYYAQMKDVPVLFVSGWYDTYSAATVENFTALRRLQKTPKWLVMGAWPHGYGRAQCGEANFGPAAALDEPSLQLDWFDHWMRGRNFQIVGAEPVRYFRMQGRSGGEWRTASSWPPGTHVRRVELREYAGEGKTDIPFDPAHPVASNGGRYTNTCVQNQTARDGVVSFTSPPLKESLDVTGNVRARLFVQSDADAADFIMTLIDVDPDGYAMPIADGQIRATKAGAVDIDVGPASNLFEAGHRIRIDIAGSSFPRLQPNAVRSVNTVWHDRTRASYVELP